jgi:splicing factor 3A subunit 3
MVVHDIMIYNNMICCHYSVRHDEIESMSGSDQFKEFYRRLKRINEYYSDRGDDFEDDPTLVEFNRLDKERRNPPEELQNLVEFTDEEGYGKFLDMHSLHTMYLNIKNVEKYDYMTYLQVFDRTLSELPKEMKGIEYKRYVESLVDYLAGYLERIQPLSDQTELLLEVKKDFEEKWGQGQFIGWKKDGATSALAKHSGATLDLTPFTSHQELMTLGLDRLKSALNALGLKCGGTLEERAKRLYGIKGLSHDRIDPSLFAKTKKSTGNEVTEQQKEIAFLEAQVYRYAELLGEQRLSTKENVERRLARTADELEDEEEEEVVEEESDDDDEETVPYNPKNLPLGFDGKPIPYWLYKLHGLNITYECEICGGAQYKGPKSFQRHFSEWRHAFGMRCLGIPNTAHFANVTNIADARALWEKLKSLKAIEQWKSTVEEEFEDSKGNVVSRKMYDDLRRQGLL